MQVSRFFDEEVGTAVDSSSMDIACVIDRSRIIADLDTLTSLIKVYSQLNNVLEDAQFNYNKMLIKHKRSLIKALEPSNAV
mmetsp:Transcript_18162/g.27950  ORF Transcript_18162/g.27950 Transcript_18162/m.27950 type:complete len:81 (+) Transcript_18162:3636-3878(+)